MKGDIILGIQNGRLTKKQKEEMKELKELYKEYDELQGNNPIHFGSLYMSRIDDRHYKLRTMRSFMDLFRYFIEKYDVNREETKEKYSIYFDGAKHMSVWNKDPLKVIEYISYDFKKKCVVFNDLSKIYPEKFY